MVKIKKHKQIYKLLLKYTTKKYQLVKLDVGKFQYDKYIITFKYYCINNLNIYNISFDKKSYNYNDNLISKNISNTYIRFNNGSIDFKKFLNIGITISYKYFLYKIINHYYYDSVLISNDLIEYLNGINFTIKNYENKMYYSKINSIENNFMEYFFINNYRLYN